MKIFSKLRLTLFPIISGICFLGGVIIGIPLILGKIFWSDSHTVFLTQYIFLSYAAFFLIILGIVVPITRIVFKFFKLSGANPFDGLATILLVIASMIPLVILSIVTFTLFRSKRLLPYRYKIFHFSISVAIVLLGAWIKYSGVRNKKASIIVSNHTSLLDYFLIGQTMGVDPFNIVAGINLARTKNTFWDKCLSWTIGDMVKKYSISIDRENGNSRVETLRKIVKELDEGKNIAIFPEGTRTSKTKIKNGILLQNFHDGAFKIAYEKKICIQPIVFDWPVIWRGKGDDWWGVHPCMINAHFLDIVDPEKFSSFEDFKNECWIAMEKQLKESKNVKRFQK